MSKPWTRHRVPAFTCSCGERLTGATDPSGDPAPPEHGMLSVCMRCGYLRIFGADLGLRDLTAAELDAVMRDPEAMALLAQMRQAQRIAARHR